MNYGKFYNIPYYDGFMISRKGYVIDSDNNFVKKYKDNNLKIYLLLDNEKCYLDKLLLNTFVGDFEADIIYEDDDYSNCNFSNIRYNITVVKDGNDILINGKVFKSIPNFNDYYISDNGVVYSTYRQKFMSVTYNHGNYTVATIINNDGYRAPQRIHRLVYMTFMGIIPDDQNIDHLDNRKYNNSIKNLELVYPHENVRRALDDGISNMRWSVDDINNICKMLESNIPSETIADKFDMTTYGDYRDLTMLIHNLTSGKQHVQITKHYNLSNYNSALNKKDRVLDESDVIYIWDSIYNGNVMIKDLSNKFNVSTSTISKIRDRKTWKQVTNKLAKNKVQRLGKVKYPHS